MLQWTYQLEPFYNFLSASISISSLPFFSSLLGQERIAALLYSNLFVCFISHLHLFIVIMRLSQEVPLQTKNSFSLNDWNVFLILCWIKGLIKPPIFVTSFSENKIKVSPIPTTFVYKWFVWEILIHQISLENWTFQKKSPWLFLIRRKNMWMFLK